MEIWKPIKGFEGFYQVSDKGNVRSLGGWCGNSKHKERILSKSLTHDGYEKVRLNRKGKDITARVHRLVAEAFIENPLHKETVNHIDGNKQNNCVENLEWCDRKEQMQHAYNLGLKKAAKGSCNCNSKLTDEDVEEIRRLYVRGSRKYGTVALGKKYGVTNRVIGLVVKRKSYC